MNGEQNLTQSSESLCKEIESLIDRILLIYRNSESTKEMKKTLPRSMDGGLNVLKKCINKMEDINARIICANKKDIPRFSVEKHLERVYEKRKGRFDGRRCYALLCKNKETSVEVFDEGKKSVKNKRRELSHEFVDKLTGFLQKRGRITWNDEKIDEFTKSMMR